MIIAVSMRLAPATRYPEPRDAISHDWIVFLESMSVTPVLVPNALRDPSNYVDRLDAQGLILTGGEDVGMLPGESGRLPTPSERDRTERELLSGAIDHQTPVFGVCRGLQVINAFFGGALARDLSAASRHINTVHPVNIDCPPAWIKIDQKETITNSFHGQGVLLTGLAPDLKAFAVADGNVVEGLYHPGHDLVAVQWHPERRNPGAELDRALFRDWLARCE